MKVSKEDLTERLLPFKTEWTVLYKNVNFVIRKVDLEPGYSIHMDDMDIIDNIKSLNKAIIVLNFTISLYDEMLLFFKNQLDRPLHETLTKFPINLS